MGFWKNLVKKPHNMDHKRSGSANIDGGRGRGANLYFTPIFRLFCRYLGSVLCKLCHFCAMGSLAASVFSIVAISIVKHRSVLLRSHQRSCIGRNTLISFVPFTPRISVSLNIGIKIKWVGTGPIQSAKASVDVGRSVGT